MPETFGSNEAGSPVVPCPLQKNRPHWVEIELRGEDDSPVPWEEYEVKLPNGDIATGYLDENGWARVENIDWPGNCTIGFPRLDHDAWEPKRGPLGARNPHP